MIDLPQTGGCVCGEIRFSVDQEPVTVYACHCTDCQTETGSVCLLGVVVRRSSLTFGDAEPAPHHVTLADGREKGGERCPRCMGPIGGGARGAGLYMLEGGAFDDTSWIVPAGHIWMRSAQGWLGLAEGTLQYAEHPRDEDWLDMTRAWRARC